MEKMKIAVCDDEEAQLAQISGYVSEYIESRNLYVLVETFRNPEDLLAHERLRGKSAVYLLDVVMDGMSGMELGRKIREYNKRAVIIYLTTAKEFSLDAFSVHAFSYIVKPFEKEKLFSELDKCFEYCIPPKRKEYAVTVKTAKGTIPVASGKINAIEYLDHRLIYHTSGGGEIASISSRDPFEKQAADASALGIFIKSAEGYMVNMQNILSVTVRGFKMKDGSEFPVTRKYADAKERFLKYKFGGGELN